VQKAEKSKEKEDLTMKETIYSGMASLKAVGNDPSALQDTLELMKDPETMLEVQRMMKDPEFIKFVTTVYFLAFLIAFKLNREMEALKNDPSFTSAVSKAKDMYEDPSKAQKLLQQIKDDAVAAGLQEKPQLSDAQLGLQELGKVARNPKLLAEAMEMLKDPSIAAEVQAMMQDPAFKAEMKQFSQSPDFQNAMKKANEQVQAISKDPDALRKLQAQAAEL